MSSVISPLGFYGKNKFSGVNIFKSNALFLAE